jgi:hypothetical protein
MAQTNIVSPLPGTYYRRPAPDQPAYKDAAIKSPSATSSA